MSDFAIIIALTGVLACVVWIIVNSWPQLRPIDEAISGDPRQKVSGSEVRYRTLFEKTSDALLILDEGRFIDCNQATVNMLGYNRREQVLQAHPSELSPKYQPDGQFSFTKANEMIATAFVRGSHRFEWMYKRANGEHFPVEVLLTAIPKENGQMLHVVWRDITERKQADEALQLSEARFRGFADAAADWFWEMGPDLRFTHLSGGVERVLGLPAEEIIGKSRVDLYKGKLDLQTEPWKKHLQRLEQRKPFSEFIVRWERPDGEYRTVSLSGNPLFDNEGAFLGYRGVGSDITQRETAEQEVRRLRNYLSNIIDSMPSMLIGVDGNGVVTQWNSEAAEVTAISADEAIGQALERVLPRLSREMPRIRLAIDSKEELVDPKRTYRRGGETRYEDITIYPLIADGAEGAVIRVDDVTEEVSIEEMMIQSEKMLSVGGLAAGMAHEINNPLAGMMQTANVLTNRLTKLDLPANQRVATELGMNMDDVRAFMEKRGVLDLIGNISESGQRMATIVANMLSFARKADAIREPFEVSDLLDKTVELAATDYNLKQQYDFKSIKIIREYAEQLPQVVCEGAKIQQVLLNLLRNGAQAMQASGTEQPRFTLRTYLESERDMVCMEVEDNGPGIDEKTRKRIFEPFFTTKSVNEGTGLGLSVSYFIVTENHGGEMGVESELGKGARFIIRLPVQDT